jgi:hypothetical protein
MERGVSSGVGLREGRSKMDDVGGSDLGFPRCGGNG